MDQKKKNSDLGDYNGNNLKFQDGPKKKNSNLGDYNENNLKFQG